MASNWSQLRDEMWKKDPHCHWCGQITILPKDVTTKSHPDNMATFDHAITRFMGFRGIQGVLSCRKCNMERGRKVEKSMPIEELQRRAKQHFEAKVRQRMDRELREISILKLVARVRTPRCPIPVSQT